MNSSHAPIICIIGPPASGKGTQAALLAKALDIPQVTIGQILRHLTEKNTPDGKRLRGIIETGSSISADIIAPVLATVVKEHKDTGVILDGFPRTKDQAELLVEEEPNVSRLIIVELVLKEQDVISRIKHRLQDPEYQPHVDDDIDVVRDKLLLYGASKRIIEKTLLKQWGKSKKLAYFQVDGSKAPEEVHHAISSFVLKDTGAEIGTRG